jgi:hypothetical protein
VVYGHRIPNGKFEGKTVLVIYGLKAYAEYSELIGRELIRFKEFEKGLHEGAASSSEFGRRLPPLPRRCLMNPVLHVGSNAVLEIFSPLLGNLLELRRHGLRQSWGLPVDEVKLKQTRQQLAALGVHADELIPW